MIDKICLTEYFITCLPGNVTLKGCEPICPDHRMLDKYGKIKSITATGLQFNLTKSLESMKTKL